jgi:hypothetical protein
MSNNLSFWDVFLAVFLALMVARHPGGYLVVALVCLCCLGLWYGGKYVIKSFKNVEIFFLATIAILGLLIFYGVVVTHHSLS